MKKWRSVVCCNDCKKIYPNGLPYFCYRCGAEIARDSMFLGLVLTNNSRRVAARRRLFKGWEVKQEDKQQTQDGLNTNILFCDYLEHAKKHRFLQKVFEREKCTRSK